MEIVGEQRWESLERWAPTLFLAGAGLELVFATNHGLAYLVDGVSFIEWVYPTVLLGRLALLLGVAGLSGRIVERTPTVGKLCRAVVGLAVVFTIGLLSLVLLQLLGTSTPIIAVFALGTVASTVLTFLLFGVVIVRTEAFATRIGVLLVAAAVTIVGVFVGTRMLPTGVVGSVGEGTMTGLFLVLWYSLGAAAPAPDRSEAAADSVAK